ncbi:uncharacterized protein N7518_001881 [Penicillium psychrosexuale]|uniref:uncharacterized protein n=1 Tax=Penicillium psychrosexuale TaxID=1002107 RepID=UPI002545A224|nr:uncharacterized protein N7518_001881 [Penicillium psychrosexuale]KAJ5799813.1 hypothetical protein N7518_001881 [Penicillium psychrosexuale]
MLSSTIISTWTSTTATEAWLTSLDPHSANSDEEKARILTEAAYAKKFSWSTYNVRAGFFSTTWTACNQEVQAEHKTSASCEGFGTSDQGGDVVEDGKLRMGNRGWETEDGKLGLEVEDVEVEVERVVLL